VSALAHELDIARRVAIEAAALVRRYHGKGVKVDRKAGDEPVTEADHAANELIVTRMREAFPQDAILSEELPDDGSRFRNRRVWMVDPIDGTSDFIQGENGYAVMIGLTIDGRPMVGAVSQPPTGVTFAGAVATGPADGASIAWKETSDGRRTRLVTSVLAGPPGIRLVASKSHRTSDVDRFRRALEIEDEINLGGVGVKVNLVAEGSRDLYVYPGGRTKIWDTCAPEAILVAAGGRMTDGFGLPLRYTDPELYNKHGILASNGPLHDLVVKRMADLRAPKAP
jgi:3'(2'), 5'-bisphosphate nucleotidase